MITTVRAAKFLQSLPDDEAAAILDTVAQVTADPAIDSPRCKRLAANLWEARITLHHRRQFRVMFGYRDGIPVLLTALEKRDSKRHQAEIEHARQELMSPTPVRQESAMPKELPIFHVTSWVYAGNRQYRIIHHTRKKIVVQTDAGPVELRRSKLERDGTDHVNGITYRTTKYWLPCEAQEIAS